MDPRHREGRGVPKNRFLGVEFSFSPQSDTSDTEKVEGRGRINFSRSVGPGMQPPDLTFP